jgi:hypothetical protein
MLEVTVYETHDGERFDNYDDACYHEANLDFAVITEDVKFFDESIKPIYFDDFDDFKRKCHSVYYITGAISLLDEFLNSESPTGDYYGDWADWPNYYESFPDYNDGDVIAIDEDTDCWVNYSQRFVEIRNIICKIKG